jgi:hypothetical protein
MPESLATPSTQIRGAHLAPHAWSLRYHPSWAPGETWIGVPELLRAFSRGGDWGTFLCVAFAAYTNLKGAKYLI